MRISKTVSITLPPDMLQRALDLAKAENRTMSELIREALRQYEFEKALHKLQAYGKKQAAKTGLREKDIVNAVKEVRKTLWPEYKKKHGLDKAPATKKTRAAASKKT